MASTPDSKGNNITQVDLPIDGQIWIGPNTVEVLNKASLMAAALDPPENLSPLGLLTTDGGPEWGTDGVGDAIDFFQDGYSLPGTGGYYTLAVTAAQNQPLVDELLNGNAFDADGYRDVTAISNPGVYTVLSQIIYQSGRIERRMSNNVTVSEGAKSKEERAAVTSTSLTFKYMPMLDGRYFAEAKFMPTVAPADPDAQSAA